MSAFTLPDSSVTVHIPAGLSKDQLLSFPAFQRWTTTLLHSLALQRHESHVFNSDPYILRSINVQAVDFFGNNRLGFVKLKAEISNADDEHLPGSVFLRGGSVAMMLVLQPDDMPVNSETDKHVILTVQPRISAGSLSFVELPAGMLDDSGTFAGAAAKEISEECGLEISESDLLNMTELAISASNDGERLQAAVYPSAGGCDEYIPIFLWQKRIPREQLQGWQGKLTGLRDEGERITLKLAKLEDVWKVGGRDGKVLAGYSLYQGLRKEGKI